MILPWFLIVAKSGRLYRVGESSAEQAAKRFTEQIPGEEVGTVVLYAEPEEWPVPIVEELE